MKALLKGKSRYNERHSLNRMNIFVCNNYLAKSQI